MIGIIVVLVLSAIILWITHREHITALGLLPTGQRVKAFLFGFVVLSLFCSVNLMGQACIKEAPYTVNPNYSFADALQGIWWTAKAALFEELIFRGALLYILIRYIGIVKACLISAVAFGVYHWFSYGMIGGRIVPMIYVFLLTGAAGWMFAFAFAKTKSILTPLGLHLGWIMMSIVIFSDGPLGEQLLISQSHEVELSGWATLVFFLWQAVLIPGLITWYLIRTYRDEHSNESITH